MPSWGDAAPAGWMWSNRGTDGGHQEMCVLVDGHAAAPMGWPGLKIPSQPHSALRQVAEASIEVDPGRNGVEPLGPPRTIG